MLSVGISSAWAAASLQPAPPLWRAPASITSQRPFCLERRRSGRITPWPPMRCSVDRRAAVARAAHEDTLEQDEPHGRSKQILVGINSATKWGVGAAAGVTLVIRHDLCCAWGLLCSIFSVIVCKVLKHVLNHERPGDNPGKTDPGMPSSHANSLAYLSTYVALSVVDSMGLSVVSGCLAGALICTATFLTWLRVSLSFHTSAQVAAGFLLGVSQAKFWWWIGHAYMFPLVEHGHTGIPITIYTLCTLFCGLFVARNLVDLSSETSKSS